MNPRTKFDSSFHLYERHFAKLSDYIGAVTPILIGNRQLVPMFVESTVVLMQAWHEDFLKSLVSTAAREQQAITREYFRKHGRKEAVTCDLPMLLKMARGRIKFDKRAEPVEDIFLAVLGFPPWPDDLSRNAFLDLNFVRQLIVHHTTGIVGDDYFQQFTDKTLLDVTQYDGLPPILRIAHDRVLIHIKSVIEKTREQYDHLRAEMLMRPQWIIQN